MQAIAPLVTALGIAQVVSWGTLFYAIGVLGTPMRIELGVSDLLLYGSFTAGLLVCGMVSPHVGRLVDLRGGRSVLAAGSLLATLAMTVLAMSTGPVTMAAGWVLAGAAMAACLYDPAFATLSQLVGPRYRRAVAALTIFGGFASTVFWPLSHILMSAWGWRFAFAVYAGLHLFVCLPLHLLFVPRRMHVLARGMDPRPQEPVTASARGLDWLVLAFGGASFVSSVIAVHVIGLLVAAGLTQAQAVSLAMLFGPMQVAGRAVELAFAPRIGVVAVGSVAIALFLLAVVALLAVQGAGVAAIVFVVAFGLANGFFTIARGTVPAELFGRECIGAILGHLARWGMYARAIAPASFSGLLALGLGRGAALACLAALATCSGASYWMAVRARARAPNPPGDSGR
jgi:MFS family permease